MERTAVTTPSVPKVSDGDEFRQKDLKPSQISPRDGGGAQLIEYEICLVTIENKI